MRKLLMSVLLLSVLPGCETKSPSGPTGLTPTTSTTTTSTMTTSPTSSSSTTTTIVLSSLARGYVAFNPPANTPSQATLFFERVLTGAAASLSLADGLPFGGPQTAQETENRYRVTGVYVMPNGTTGTITGILGGSSNPLETGGDFSGTLTARTPAGCTAERQFAGRLNPQTLQWSGGEPGTSTCSPSPLAIPTINMLRSDPAAPLPPVPTTTSVTTTTTTTVLCNYSLSSVDGPIPGEGGTRSVSITAPAGCAWSAQSYADWIVVRQPHGGSGPATVTIDVLPNSTGAVRSGTLLIAGIQVTVTQSAALADLVPEAPGGTSDADFCRLVDSGISKTGLALRVRVRNQGAAGAGASLATVSFDPFDGTPVTVPGDTLSIAAGGFVEVDFPLNATDTCGFGCAFTIQLDVQNAVSESNEMNNTQKGVCNGERGSVTGAGRLAR